MSAEPLRHMDQAHRPFPHDALRPQVTEVFMLNGKGWASPDLAALLRDHSHAMVRQACDELGLDPRRQNIFTLRCHLEQQEERLK